MSYQEVYFAERDMDLRVGHELAQAEKRRLARQLSAQPDQGLSWELRWMMCGLGLKLVALGARIEARFLPPAKSAENGIR